ncbi:hypothetical protein BJV82DRAFT_615499 [Fennellomyces sp. T-0311]|nr:hypothetical protein BJV82DRAFT_615499 [Fennellomyces sp. T-0311]
MMSQHCKQHSRYEYKRTSPSPVSATVYDVLRPQPPNAHPPTIAILPKQPPRQLTLSVADKLKRIPDPPVCYCGKTAYRSESDLGVMYDCYRMEKNGGKICGFHVHQRAWDNFRERLKRNQDLDEHDPELMICPYFNYTFCVSFLYINDYARRYPKPPTCFCNLQVAISEEHVKEGGRIKKRIAFRCPHHAIDGAKPKCTWSCAAELVYFKPPRHPLHSVELLEHSSSLSLRSREATSKDEEE